MGLATTYAGLQSALRAWLDDEAIDAPECIALAEKRFNRVLTATEMETSATLTIIDGAAMLPADLLELRAIFLDTDARLLLEPAPLAIVQGAQSFTGMPRHYALSGARALFAPFPDADYRATLTYRQAIPELSTETASNWLLARHPDLYLAASVAMAEFKGWNDARLPMLKAWCDELIAEINALAAKRRNPGTIRLRPAVSESVRGSVFAGLGAFASSDLLTDG